MSSPNAALRACGLSPRAFLCRYWQKRPLFIPQAFPGFAGWIDKRTLAALAARDDVESRIVERRGKRRETRHGPFEKATIRKTGATLLVSGVDLVVSCAPLFRTPVSNASPVAVCSRSSSFTNVTLPPAAIVTADGPNVRPAR